MAVFRLRQARSSWSETNPISTASTIASTMRIAQRIHQYFPRRLMTGWGAVSASGSSGHESGPFGSGGVQPPSRRSRSSGTGTTVTAQAGHFF
ncbi:Uncharacterised protein [Mycobacteroides abscessus subsp. abscessus]|nr:Uncharacterised protein [Mycobacteroides abscessus subsp. abscessus]